MYVDLVMGLWNDYASMAQIWISLYSEEKYSDLMPRGRPHLMAQEGRKSR